MSKFSKQSKLSPEQRQKLVYSLCQTLASFGSDEEVAQFIVDLLSPQEMEMLAKRLGIAELLLSGADYQTIRSKLKVGLSTIAHIATWLERGGEGYRIAFKRKPSPNRTKKTSPTEFDVRRKYHIYYWPELFIEELIKKSDETHRNKITSILCSMGVKKEIFTPELNKLLFADTRSKKRHKSLALASKKA